MTSQILAGISVILTCAWLPVVFYFFARFRERDNPISLAICGSIGLLMYSNVVFAFAGNKYIRLASVFMHLFNLVAIVNFYLSFYWAKKKFKDQRHPHA